MRKSRSVHALLQLALEKGYTVAEIIIVFAVIAFHVACVLPGFLHVRKRSHT
jgi:Tfp pilus assembly protein FimT